MNVLHCPSWLQRVRTVEVALFKLFFMKALFVWLLHLRCELRGQKGPVRQTVVTKTPGLFYLPAFLQRGLHVCVRLIINVNIGAIFRLERINALLTLVCIGTRGGELTEQHYYTSSIVPGDASGWSPEDSSPGDPREVRRDQGGGPPRLHHRQLSRHQAAGPRDQDSASNR